MINNLDVDGTLNIDSTSTLDGTVTIQATGDTTSSAIYFNQGSAQTIYKSGDGNLKIYSDTTSVEVEDVVFTGKIVSTPGTLTLRGKYNMIYIIHSDMIYDDFIY